MQARWSVTQCGERQNVWDSYARQGGRIGAGGFGFVYKAQSRKSKEMVAVKAVPKLDLKRAPPSTAPEQLVQMRRRDAQRLREEIKIMRLLDHPNIVMLHETFEDAESVFLVMELCSGGELLGFILESGHHSEMQAAIVMRQVFKAVRYMHSQQVCHRDLKHSNTLLLSHAPCHENVVKVVDFGLACSFTPGEVLRQCAGTVVYVAPQVLECRYDHRVDLWSCGVLLYILLCGYPPFRGETDAAIMTAIRRGNYSFPARDWSIVSENAKALIRSLLKMKVKDRISIEDALEHSWTQDPPGDGAQLSKTLERIRKFMAHQNQTQDVNPQQNEAPPAAETEVGDDAGGPMKCASQSSIATRIPSSPGAWFQEQFAAITAAVGSVMSSKSKKDFVASEEIASSGPELPGDKEKPGVREAVPQGDKDMSPSQVFLMKHLEEDERQAQQAKMILEELSPASLVFRQKHVEHEDSPQSKQLIEEVSPRVSPRPATPKVSLSPRVSPRPEAFQMPKEDSPRVEAPRPEAFRVPKASEAIFSGPRAEAPFCPPVWLDPLPGESLMDLSSTEKPVVNASDDLPPPPEPPEDPPESDPESPDSPRSRAFVGQPLEFFSKTAQRWLPCEVINVRSDLAIMVTVKPNTWLSLEDQRIRIREPQVKDRGVEQDHQQDLGQLMVGQAVEYFSASAGRWIPCEVTMVDAELIPPTAYCGGWLCFVMAIGAIGVLTCAICDFAELFGCVTSLEDSITAITIVALGTSMPDLFASQTAAVTDRYADASIVNVTGSNSVNVFLDIGLPWSIAAIYWSVAGPTQKWLDSYESHLGTWPKAAFIVQGGDLAFSVAVFNVAAGLALLIIHLRRSRLQGELGGPGGMKVLSGLLLISLWLFYLTLSIWKIKSNTTDIGTQIFAIFIGFCSLENLVLLFSCALLMRFGTAFFTGRPGQQADDEEAARLVADGREVASKGDLRHVARPGLSPVAPPAFTVKEVHGRPECYGRQNKSLDISFTSAAFVCFAAKRLQRAGRKVAESFRGLPPMPPPMFPPPSTTLSALSPVGPQGGIERVPSFYSIDSQEGRDRQRRPSLTGRMAGLISGHAADWAALTVAGLAAGTLADPNGPRFLG